MNNTKNSTTGQVKKELKFRIEKNVNLILRQITTILRIFEIIYPTDNWNSSKKSHFEKESLHLVPDISHNKSSSEFDMN